MQYSACNLYIKARIITKYIKEQASKFSPTFVTTIPAQIIITSIISSFSISIVVLQNQQSRERLHDTGFNKWQTDGLKMLKYLEIVWNKII